MSDTTVQKHVSDAAADWSDDLLIDVTSAFSFDGSVDCPELFEKFLDDMAVTSAWLNVRHDTQSDKYFTAASQSDRTLVLMVQEGLLVACYNRLRKITKL